MAMLVPLLLAVASSVTASVSRRHHRVDKATSALVAVVMLEQWTGWVLFAPLAALSGFGIWLRWSGPQSAPGFFSSWLLFPMFALAAFSWAVFSLISARLKCVRAEPA
jgi:hypothetical protein